LPSLALPAGQNKDSDAPGFEPGLIDRDQFAIGPGLGRGVVDPWVNQSQLGQDTSRTDCFNQTILPEKLDFPGLNNVHDLAGLALLEDQFTGQESFALLFMLKKMGSSHSNAPVFH
jgi:hypothetical protein